MRGFLSGRCLLALLLEIERLCTELPGKFVQLLSDLVGLSGKLLLLRLLGGGPLSRRFIQLLKRFGHLLLLLGKLLRLCSQFGSNFSQRFSRGRCRLLSIARFVRRLSKLPPSGCCLSLRALLSRLRCGLSGWRISSCLLSRLDGKLCRLSSQLFLLSK